MHWPAVSGLLATSLAVVSASPLGNSTTVARSLATTCTPQVGIDFVGKDIASVGGVPSSACCDKCHATQGCKAYTWNDFNGGTCWLKSGVSQVQSYSGAVSGTVDARSEENTDYIGNDVGSAPGAKASDCVAKCKAAAGCGAYTWSDWNGGTCWLKSGRGSVRAAAGVHSAEVSEDVDAKWTLQEGKDYQGYDLSNVRGADATQCTKLCGATTGCRAFTWSDWNGGTCWLKTARGTAVDAPGVTSGVLDNGSSEQCELMQSADIVGNDIGSVRASDAGACCTLCSKKAGCGAYTWTQWDGGVCWFKSAVGDLKPSPGAVSGRVRASTPHVQYALRSGSIPSRSVNLGGWLVSEYWMSKTSAQWKDVPTKEAMWNEQFNPAVHTAWGGEYITMKYWNDRGERERGVRQFEEHRKTWITEDDLREIRDVGLNMVRVPVGFWIVDDIPGVQATDISKVYAPGSLKYLDTLINDWAVKYNIAVMLSLHSHQGSQNGNDHSAPQEMWNVGWSKDQANYQSSLRFATKLAERYKDAPAFLGLGLMNEPTDIDYELAKKFYIEAYQQIRATGNDCILAVAPRLSEQNQWTNREFMRWPQFTNIWTEWHVYYKWGYEGQNEYQILDSVRGFHKDHFDNWPGNWVFMGEWSLGNPGEALFKDRNLLKQFAALQLEQFNGAHAGWAFWSWHHDDEKLDGVVSGWSLRQLLRLGVMTVPK